MNSTNPETHACDCGFTWRHGQSGTHLCGPQYRKTIAELRAAAAPQVVADKRGLPPLPECWSASSYRPEFAVYTGDQMQAYARAALAAAPVQAQHSDDAAIDRFAAIMKAKMAASRAKGRSGWDDPAQCTVEKLAAMLCQHVEKGDPVDIANFAMMIHERHGSAIDVYEALAVFLNSRSITTPVQAQEPVAAWRVKYLLNRHTTGPLRDGEFWHNGMMGSRGNWQVENFDPRQTNKVSAVLECEELVPRASVQPVAVPDGGIYQIALPGVHMGLRWYDVTKADYEASKPDMRRIVFAAPAAQGDAMTEYFDTWWAREQACPEHNLITENAARAAWAAAIAAKAAS